MAPARAGGAGACRRGRGRTCASAKQSCPATPSPARWVQLRPRASRWDQSLPVTALNRSQRLRRQKQLVATPPQTGAPGPLCTAGPGRRCTAKAPHCPAVASFGQAGRRFNKPCGRVTAPAGPAAEVSFNRPYVRALGLLAGPYRRPVGEPCRRSGVVQLEERRTLDPDAWRFEPSPRSPSTSSFLSLAGANSS